MNTSRALLQSFSKHSLQTKSVLTNFSINRFSNLSSQKLNIFYQTPILKASSSMMHPIPCNDIKNSKLSLSSFFNPKNLYKVNQTGLLAAYMITLTHLIPSMTENQGSSISLFLIMGSWITYTYSWRKVNDNNEKYYLQLKHYIISNQTLYFHKFDQSDFYKSCSLIPHLFNDKGYCFGHTIMWYKFQLQKKNYIAELEEIDATLNLTKKVTSLSNEHYYLLANISYIQNHQWQTENTIATNITDAAGRHKVVNQIINHADRYPYELFSIIIKRKHSSHIVGVIGTDDGIKYFDSNVGEATFTNLQAARKSLTRLLAYQYANKSYFSAFNICHHIIWKNEADVKNNQTLENELKKNTKRLHNTAT